MSPVRARQIIAAVAAYYGYSPHQLIDHDRAAHVTQARHLAMYLCRELTDLSYPALGRLFNRDHTTILHAHRRIENDLTWRATLNLDNRQLREELTA